MSNAGSIKMLISETMYYNDMDYAEALEESMRILEGLEADDDETNDEWE